MGAARYIGRVGGLAVALGVGAAIFTGYGVAWAEPASSSGGSGAHPSTAGSSTTPGPKTAAGSLGTRSTPVPVPNILVSILPKNSKAAGSGDTTGGLKHHDPSLSAGSSPKPATVGSPTSDSLTTGSPTSSAQQAKGGTVGVANVVVSSPTVTPQAATTFSTQPSVTAPATAVVTTQPTTATTTPNPVAGISNLLVTVANDLLNPSAGNGPTPPVDPPTAWTLLAFTRRELSGATVALDPAGPIAVNPTLTLTDGIVYGNANALDSNSLPLAYTIVSSPNQGGKITYFSASDGQPAGEFTYLPYKTVVTGAATEQFSELVSQTTPLDQALLGLPLVGGLLVSPILTALYQAPVVSTLLAPLIGAAVDVPFSSTSVPGLTSGNPVAYTYLMPSFDGTPISINFFPASGLKKGQTAPTILDGPGIGARGNTDPLSQWTITDLVPGLLPLRGAGYNVITWDPRGEFASGGTLQLDNPFFEGRDVSSIIDYVAQHTPALLDGPNDPRIGMVGGSYGGGIQLVSAGIDPRIDAIVPAIAWNSFNSSLYPDTASKASYASLLLLDLVTTGARINAQLYPAFATGVLLGFLTQSAQALLASSGPTALDANIKAPTLFIQQTVDPLFPLAQAVANAAGLPATTPDAMVWSCGSHGHGTCLNPGADDDGTTILADTLAWLNTYVAKTQATPGIPVFEWQDQTGQNYTSTVLPSNPTFDTGSITATSAGGTLPIIPIIGGSGPQSQVSFPSSLTDAAPASNAINVTIPASSIPTGTHIVGAPTLSFDYQGLGTSRVVYAQIVDNKTGLVLGNVVTPVPVTLNGQPQTISVTDPALLADIVYTQTTGDSLTLQIVGSATPYENFTSVGVINVSNITLTLPTTTNATPVP